MIRSPALKEISGGYVMNMGKIGVYVVEKQELLREGLLALLAREADVELVGVSDDGSDALARIPLLRVNVVLLATTVGDENSANFIRDLSQANPDAKVIVLANYVGEGCVRAALTLGVAGYVLKNDSHTELMLGIRSVVQGKTYLSSGFSQFVVSSYAGPRISDQDRRNIQDRRSRRRDRRNGSKVSKIADVLTYRERQIIKLIAEGRKNKEIAKTLSISPKTVEKHRANLMKKLDRHSISQLTIFAMEHGLLATEFATQVQT